MNRRSFLTAATAAALAVPLRPLWAQAANTTDWRVRESEGFDAIAFLGPLSGRDLYRKRYAADADAFAARLPADIRAEILALWQEAEPAVGLFWPSLTTFLSGIELTSIEAVIAALGDPERAVRPSYQASSYWDADDWTWFAKTAPRIRRVFEAMQAADFAGFRKARAGELGPRIGEVQRALAGYDVIKWQRKLTGRAFDPVINIYLLQFSKPHGVKVQGQAFLQAADYDIATTVRIAAHEMLHPPFPMDGPIVKAALATLGKDPLITRIVREHDPKWGYTTLEGLLNEDMCEALDQMISEALGVARDPADRWRKADDGMHVLAAGLYGLLRQDGWAEKGGSIEAWLDAATRAGRLAPAMLHPAAVRVLERPADQLWPAPKPAD